MKKFTDEELKAFVDLPLEDAEAKAAYNGLLVRIASRNGKPKVITSEFRTDRINFDLKEKIVTNAYIG